MAGIRGYFVIFLLSIYLQDSNQSLTNSARTTKSGFVRVEATPSVVYDGVTGQVDLNCSFLSSPESSINTVVSIILSKTISANVFQELATVTSARPGQVEVNEALGATVTGQLSDHSAFISYQWDQGSSHLEGTYKCEAFGMDEHGHPHMENNSTRVTLGSLTTNMLMDKIRKMEETQTSLQTRLDQALSQLNTQKDCASKTIESRLNASMKYITEASMSYNGHYYFLSRFMLMNHPDAASRCHLYGGYLAEMDDKNEYDVLRNFMKTNDQVKSYIALGGTDYHHDGIWTLEESGELMNYTNFYPGEPNRVNTEDCLYHSEYWGGKMVNYVCNGLTWMRFLCEIPQQTNC